MANGGAKGVNQGLGNWGIGELSNWGIYGLTDLRIDELTNAHHRSWMEKGLVSMCGQSR
jgi:hypothetical protein